MGNRGPAPVDHPAFQIRGIGGMDLYACSYVERGVEYCISLYATEEAQLIEDNCDMLENFTVHGVIHSQVPADDETAWAMIDKWEKSNES